MKKIIGYMLIPALCYCNGFSYNNWQYSKSSTYNRYEFCFDNTDLSAFGFEYFDNDESIGPKSIFISDQFAYIADTYHSNIKKINLLTGEMNSSVSLCNNRAWLRDIIEFDNMLFVLTDLAANYVLDKNLNLIKEIQLPAGSKYGLKSGEDYLLIYSSGKVIYLNHEGKVAKEKNEFHNILQTIRGKEYDLSDESIITEYGSYIHSGSYTPTWEYYDAVNIDFNSSFLAFFTIDKSCLSLYVFIN